MKYAFLIAGIASILCLPALTPWRTQTAAVSAKLETAPVPTEEDAADDLAFWVHPTRPELSLVIGTDKDRGLAVYDLDGKQREFLAHGRLNNVDIRYRFPLGGARVALVTSGDRGQNVLSVFMVDEQRRTLSDASARVIQLGFAVEGCCMYQSPTTGETYFFGTSEEGVVQQWRLFDDGSGRVDAEHVRTFDVGGQCESCVADDENGWFFVGEEEVGIWRYGAEPSAGDDRVRVDTTGVGGHLEADVEGLAIYYAQGGEGYLVASSQGSNSFVVYDRRAPHAHRLSFEIAASSAHGVDEVTDTDGIDLVNFGLGSGFPGGMFAAQDGSNPGGNQNFKLVDWRDIASAAKPPLKVDPTYDALGARQGE